ncbi:MAG: NgoFVII family restriction endonuclease [Campylobacterales bacterium]|nr:NgoFVII family restriction endonuclease [Campylobacterales bacterium]MBN2832656.1 NgoFVII family restriction endonuclease [Campylobacterales bacterium]
MYDSEQQKQYENLLKAFSSLTKLFSDNNQPYLEYRAMENIYCKSFNAINLAREDGAFDAKIGDIGIGLKTFGIKDNSVEKVAEFNKYSYELKKLDKDTLAQRLAILRNERIITATNLHSLTKRIYHCIGRYKNELVVFETEYPLIDIGSLSHIKQTDKSLFFKDRDHEYRFNFSKSVLMKKFSLEQSTIISKIDIKIFENPYDAILRLLDLIPCSVNETNHTNEYVILPLYSTRNKHKKEVQERAGLNQWNANGEKRKRKFGEIYIPIPAKVRDLKKDFFPLRDISFNLKTPDGSILSAKVCQDGSKALMTNPNNAMSDWLLKKVFGLKEWELLTYEKLQNTGFDSVKIIKLDSLNFEITLSNLDSYEDWIEQEDK